ncbi:phage tail assembly chaperone [Pseudomonas sp. NPDC086581]|uniref:phage tail assembly chaperone n=1 Tax=Pseudomonas sp. NPDC086581 TaxID=3364432 RepID=UPI00382643A7
MARQTKMPANLLAFASDPLANFKHERVTIEEWGNAELIVRALSAEDWAGYRDQLNELEAVALQQKGYSSREEVPEGVKVAINVYQAYAYVLCRCLYYPNGERAFPDVAVATIAPAYGPIHDRLVTLAFNLSGAAVSSADPVADAGNA